jgi:hypothetical protein
MAVMGKIAWDSNFDPAAEQSCESPAGQPAHKFAKVSELTSVFRGRELTRKDHRIPCGIFPVDKLIDGGIARGRISEIIAQAGAGKTSLAAAFAARVTQREAAAWIDNSDDFDPASIATAGVELTRLLWVSSRRTQGAQVETQAEGKSARYNPRLPVAGLKVAEWILAAGGFGLVILDYGASAPHLPQSTVLRLARSAERCGAAVLVLAPRRICGTFAALSLTLRRKRGCFSRSWPGAPTLFEGLRLEVCVTRNKLGSSGQTVKWETAIDGATGWSAGQDSLSILQHSNLGGSRTALTKHLSSQAEVRLTRTVHPRQGNYNQL